MAKKNLCALIDEDLHTKVCEARDKAGLTNSEYVTQLLTEYFMMKENGGNTMTQVSGKTRTMAFQISEELFQRIKEHLERETRRLGYKVTQKDFVIGLIQAALAEAEQETVEAPTEPMEGEPQTDSEPDGEEADPAEEEQEVPAEPEQSEEPEATVEPEAAAEEQDGGEEEAEDSQPVETDVNDTTGE